MVFFLRLRWTTRTMKKTAAAISARKIAQSHQTAAVVSTASCTFSPSAVKSR